MKRIILVVAVAAVAATAVVSSASAVVSASCCCGCGVRPRHRFLRWWVHNSLEGASMRQGAKSSGCRAGLRSLLHDRQAFERGLMPSAEQPELLDRVLRRRGDINMRAGTCLLARHFAAGQVTQERQAHSRRCCTRRSTGRESTTNGRRGIAIASMTSAGQLVDYKRRLNRARSTRTRPGRLRPGRRARGAAGLAAVAAVRGRRVPHELAADRLVPQQPSWADVLDAGLVDTESYKQDHVRCAARGNCATRLATSQPPKVVGLAGPLVDSDRRPNSLAANVLARPAPLLATAYSGAAATRSTRWLLDCGLAQPNGSPDTFQLTEHGLDVAAGVRELQAWIDPDRASLDRPRLPKVYRSPDHEPGQAQDSHGPR